MPRILQSETQDEKAYYPAAFFSKAASYLRPLTAEYFQLEGLENLVENGNPKTGPFLWLFKHESDLDLVNLMPLWQDLPQCAPMKVVMGYPHVSAPFLSKIVVSALSPAFVPIHGVSWIKDVSEEEKQKLRQKNEETLETITSNLERGKHIVVFPEGTTRSNGYLSKIKRGSYYLSHWKNSQNEIECVQCVPVGNTYDFLSGKGRKPLVFLNIGEPFHYEPIRRIDGESEEEYGNRDRITFLDQIKDHFLDLNTITASQLAGEYLYRVAELESYVTCSEILSAVKRRVEALRRIPGLHFDEALLNSDSLRMRVDNFYQALAEHGYIEEVYGTACLNSDHLHHVPGKINSYQINCLSIKGNQDSFKQENILLYMVNRIRHVAEERKEIADVLAEVL